jgi:hypothetical protein
MKGYAELSDKIRDLADELGILAGFLAGRKKSLKVDDYVIERLKDATIKIEQARLI